VTTLLLLGGTSFLRTAVLFIAFGLLMSLVWIRLLAPDIALAEAAIGAAITGVLLIDSLRHMEWKQPRDRGSRTRSAKTRWAGWAASGSALALLLILLSTLPEIVSPRAGLADLAHAHMEKVEHPVTAVLLIFRSFDTLLELGILLLTVLGMLAVREEQQLDSKSLRPPNDLMLEMLVRILVPLSVCIAGYTLWLGTFSSGGAFQAGVILSGAGVLLWLSGHRSIEAIPHGGWFALVLVGFGAFVLAGIVTVFWQDHALQLPSEHQYLIVLGLEAAAAISVGAGLTALFVGLHPRHFKTPPSSA
jgi:multisubunit Na+/H+ antiporter MnhB subunit